MNFDIETLLQQTLDQHLKKKNGITPPHLEESIQYSLLAPGKRIRPRLLLACSEMLEIPTQDIVPAALGLEMIHCFTLIHDDLPCMDNDDFRRGMPSNHKKFGEGIALLAGDALLALGIEVFLDSAVPEKYLFSGLKRFLGAIGPHGVIGGQAAESLLDQNSTLENLQNMHSQKTGALFSAALLIPKDFAGISDASEPGRTLSLFAHELGLAFQVADDFEDSHGQANSVPATPTSVLFYQSRENAARMTIQSLNSATQRLCTHWGQKALPLKTIADEVIHKIESA